MIVVVPMAYRQYSGVKVSNSPPHFKAKYFESWISYDLYYSFCHTPSPPLSLARKKTYPTLILQMRGGGTYSDSPPPFLEKILVSALIIVVFRLFVLPSSLDSFPS